ncbi:hypothetical protein [Roseibium sp.]|uniref:hypothetical protein n=1 Tax=Roseibium sp. TaxID=1936156 RepID=UPI003A98348A
MSGIGSFKKTIGATSVAAMLLGGVAFITSQVDGFHFVTVAMADNHGGGGGQGGGGQGGGGHGGGGGGQGGGGQGGGGGHSGGGGGHSDGGDSHSGGSDSHSSGGKKGGHDNASSSEDDSDGRGPKYGKPGESRSKPVWAQEGIPEVELGRLNVARSPSNVLDRARQELVTSTVYSINTDAYASVDAYIAHVADWDNAKIVDSPLENLAVFRDAINNVTTLPGTTVGVDLMAITLGTASDKGLPITNDTVTAIVTILGGDPSTLNVPAIAAAAESVRRAVADAHG